MRSTLKTLLTAVGALGLALLPAASPAWAADPVTVPSGTNIVDQANVLGARKGDVQKAVSDLLSQHKVNLYVVIVDSFTNPSDRAAWAQAVAKNKQMGSQDVLLAIATAGQYQIEASTSNTKVYPKISAISQNAVVPNLGGGKRDYAQAAIDTAAAVGDAAAGGSGSVSSGNFTPLLVGGGVIVAAGAAGAYALSRRRKRAVTQGVPAETDPLAGLSIDELRKRASGLLVQADDAIKSGEQELGFAEASYGADAVGTFAKAIADAKAQLSESFKLQQQLDDHIPDTPQQQRAWLGEIIQRSQSAIQSLADQKTDFDSLRELERNAPAALDNVAAGVERATARLASAEETLTSLRAEYAESAVKQVSDNIAQAKDRLAFVESASAQGRQDLTEGQTGPAAVSVRAAEEALHQSGVLLDAIDRTSAALGSAKERLGTALADTESDLAQAKAMTQGGQHGELAGPIAGVESVLAQARQELSGGGKTDPVSLLARVEKAHQQLDDVLTGVRDKEQQAQRAAAALQQAIRSAQDAISATNDYIAARRGGVGTEARTRLAEAQRNLDYALSIAQSDPTSALAYAEQANSLAQQAAQIAQQDVDQFAGFGGFGMGGGRNFGGGIGGAILGGILIDSILHGGHHDGGSWGGGGGWGGGGDGGGFGGWGGEGGGFGGDGGGFGGDGGSF